MQIDLAARNAARGWHEIPDSCPPEFRARIIQKREARLKHIASSTPAAVAPKRISDAARNALATRLTNAIRLF